MPSPDSGHAESLNADDLDFDESHGFSDLVDGMVSLTVEPHRAGYMGTESGSAALKFLNELSACTPRPSPASPSGDGEADTVAALTRPPELNRLLDDYFTVYHPAYPILHEPTFRAQISGKPGHPPSPTSLCSFTDRRRGKAPRWLLAASVSHCTCHRLLCWFRRLRQAGHTALPGVPLSPDRRNPGERLTSSGPIADSDGQLPAKTEQTQCRLQHSRHCRQYGPCNWLTSRI